MRMVSVAQWNGEEIFIDADKVLTVREWKDGLLFVRFVLENGEHVFRDSLPNFMYRIQDRR